MIEAANFSPASVEAPRRRFLTILFADLCDSTVIASHLEDRDEDYWDLIKYRLRPIYEEIIAKHGGEIEMLEGDGIYALFGHLEEREDEGRRTVEAALDLHDAVRKLGAAEQWGDVPLRLHSGIHSGRVLFQPGDSARARFEALGLATNIAHRLCSAAAKDEIVVSEETLGPDQHRFEIAARCSLWLKGIAKPVPALTIKRRLPVRSRYAASVRGGLTPFVGRAAELEQLGATLAAALGGDNRFVAIKGAPGVGKTRLAHEVLHRAVPCGFDVHRGECEAGAEPLHPFLQILRSVLGLDETRRRRQGSRRLDDSLSKIDPALLVHRATLLHLLSGGGAETAGQRTRPDADVAIAALRDLFEKLTERAPLLLFIDDWQLADDATRELVSVLRGIEGRPLFLLVTARTSEEGERRVDDAEVLELAPLSGPETDRTVRNLLRSPDPFQVDAIQTSSGGNPLFIEELCHSVVSGQRQEGRPRSTAWLKTLVASRFARLPQAQADLARVAAVIGTVVPSWLLELITGRGEQDPLVAGLAKEDFLFRGDREGTLKFKHALTRDAIYEWVGRDESRALHLQIGEALRAHARDHGEEEPVESLAYHFGAGGDAAATAHYAERAGDKAMAASALDRAQAQYKAALAALDRLPTSPETVGRWGALAQRFGRAGVFDPSREQLPIFERAHKLARQRDDGAALARAEFWHGYIYYGLGEPRTAIRHWQGALAAAPGGPGDRLSVRLRAALGQGHAAACDYRQALPFLDEAIDYERRNLTGKRPPIDLAYCLSCKAFALGDMARFDEAYACFEEAIEAIRGAGHEGEVSVLNQYSAVCLWQGRLEEAIRLAEAGARVAERVRSRYSHAMSRSLAAFARWTLDENAEDIETIVEATAWLETSERWQFTSLNYGWLAKAMVASGRIPEARAYAARALLRARKGDRLGEAMACRAMARAAAREEWRKTAEHYLERATCSARLRESPHEAAANLLCEGELALQQGDQPAATAAFRRACRNLSALQMDRQAQRAERLSRSLAH